MASASACLHLTDAVFWLPAAVTDARNLLSLLKTDSKPRIRAGFDKRDSHITVPLVSYEYIHSRNPVRPFKKLSELFLNLYKYC